MSACKISRPAICGRSQTSGGVSIRSVLPACSVTARCVANRFCWLTAPLGAHTPVGVAVFGCLCCRVHDQEKVSLASAEGRVPQCTASPQEGRRLAPSQRRGRKVSDQCRPESSGDANTRGAECRRTPSSLRVGPALVSEAVRAPRRLVTSRKGRNTSTKTESILAKLIPERRSSGPLSWFRRRGSFAFSLDCTALSQSISFEGVYA